MQISAINAFQYSKGIQFESRKNKENTTHKISTNPVKALPVAVLIAMSPLNTTALAQSSGQQAANKPATEILAGQEYFTNGTPDGLPCRVDTYKSDENKKLELHLAKKIPSYGIDTKGEFVDAYRLREIHIVPEGLESSTVTKSYSTKGKLITTKYYVIGSGTEHTGIPQALDSGTILRDDARTISREFKNEKYEISLELYKHLKKVLKGQVDINEEHSSSFVIEGRR